MDYRVWLLALAVVGCEQKKDAPGSPTLAATSAARAGSAAPASSAAPMALGDTPACTSPEMLVYLEANKPTCARPCKADADCPSGQACSETALKVAGGVGTARDAVDICSTKKPTATTTDAGGPKRVSRTAQKLDTADWKDSPAGSVLDVKWTIDQTKAKPPITGGSADDLTKHTVPLDLTLTLGGHPHALALETNGAAPFSDACSRVSFFFAGLNILFQLERAEGGRAVLTRTKTSESGPSDSRQLHVFDLPADVKVAQEIVTIDPQGKRVSKKCSAPSLP
jgi:hypothetical protein